MRSSYSYLRSLLNLDTLITAFRSNLTTVPDPRKQGNLKISLVDALMSGLAIFLLKYPSLLNFDSQTIHSQNNLRKLFKLQEIPSDSGLRQILDQVDWKGVQNKFTFFFRKIKSIGLHKEYLFLGKYLLLSVDGVEHFRSSKCHCSHCLIAQHKDGTKSYYHKMLVAALVHPDKAQVFPVGAEPIIKADGTTKNDCEQNASKRLLNWLSINYKKEKFIFLEDALYATAPHIQAIRGEGWNFILNVKPKSHKKLFKQFETRKANKRLIHQVELSDEKGTYRIHFFNNVAINETHPEVKVNFIHLEFTNKKGKTLTFSWVTSIRITKRNAFEITKAGRGRWKIENETFNTLKNLGYYFEHNYGHGKAYLSTVLAFLMLFAFTMDQLVEALNQDFQHIKAAAKTRAKVWEVQRSCFLTQTQESFEQLYRDLKLLFGLVEQEPD